jgi:hypothetical protein
MSREDASCGCNSAVECFLAKEDVVSSNLIARSLLTVLTRAVFVCLLLVTLVVIGMRALAVPPQALVYAQFQRGEGRSFVYLDPQHHIFVKRHAILFHDNGFNGLGESPDLHLQIVPRVSEDGVDLYALDRASGTETRLTWIGRFPPIEHVWNNMRSNTYPVWSPDGMWVAFVSTDLMANMEIYVMRPNGDDLRQLTDDVSSPAPLQLRWTDLRL